MKWIRCEDDADARRILAELSREGYHAVRASQTWINVTGKDEAHDKERNGR